MTRPRTSPLCLAGVVALLAVILLAATPASAHGGDGEVTVTTSREDGGDEVTVLARVIYVDDGHGVPDATVTVVVDDGTPTPMEAGATEGDYTATVTAAAGATIRVTSVEPATSTEVAAPEVDAPSTTTEATTTTEAPTSTEAPTTTGVPADEEDAAVAPTAATDEADDDGGSAGLVVGGVVAVLVVAGVIAAVLLRRKPGGPADA